MDFQAFFEKCQCENTVSDFESYLAYCIFDKQRDGADCTIEDYSHMRDLAFDGRDEGAARALFDLAGVSGWREGEWEGALR